MGTPYDNAFNKAKLLVNKYSNDLVKRKKYQAIVDKLRSSINTYKTKQQIKKQKPVVSKPKTVVSKPKQVVSKPKQVVSKPKPVVNKDLSKSITEGQKNTNTYTKINKPNTNINTGTVSIPTGQGTTNSGLPTNKTISGQPISGGSSSNDIYNTLNTGIDKLNSYDKNLNYRLIKKYGSLDSFYNTYKKSLDDKKTSGKLNDTEYNDLLNKFNKVYSDKTGYKGVGIIEDKVKNPGTGRIKTGTDTYVFTDSEGKSHTSRSNHYENIDYNDITNKVAGGIFGNETFKNNFDQYINSLKDQLDTQKAVLEAKNEELKSLYLNQDETFKNKFGKLYDEINQREEDTKSKFGDIEESIKQQYEDVNKTLANQKAGEKAGIASNLRAKGMSEGAISNALAGIDKKYEQKSRDFYSNYADNLKSLASQYDNLAKSITSNKTNLTQQELNFSNALLNKAESLTNAAAEFDTNSVSTLYKPVNDIYKESLNNANESRVNTEKKTIAIERFKNADPITRKKILSDNLIRIKGLGIDVSGISNSVLDTASSYDDITSALTYIMEQLKGTGTNDSTKIDNVSNKIKDYFKNNNESDTKKSSDMFTIDMDKKNVTDSAGNSLPQLPQSNATLDITKLPYGDVQEIEGLIDKGTNRYLNSTNSKFGNSDNIKNTFSDIVSKAQELDSKYPGASDYIKNKLNVAVNEVKKAKDYLIEQVALNSKLNKKQAEKLVNYGVGNNPKNIIKYANNPDDFLSDFIG